MMVAIGYAYYCIQLLIAIVGRPLPIRTIRAWAAYNVGTHFLDLSLAVFAFNHSTTGIGIAWAVLAIVHFGAAIIWGLILSRASAAPADVSASDSPSQRTNLRQNVYPLTMFAVKLVLWCYTFTYDPVSQP